MRTWLVPGVCAVALASGPAQAATYVVTQTGDGYSDFVCDAHCTLRDAVYVANQTPEADTIVLGHHVYWVGLAPEYYESNPRNGDFEIAGELTIRGPADGATLDANLVDRAFEIQPGAKVQILNLTMRNGRRGGHGGTIYNAGDLTLRHCAIIDGRIRENLDNVFDGGGIYNVGVLRVIATRFVGNLALNVDETVGGRGGALFNGSAGTVYVYDSEFSDNAAGGDAASGYGGAIYNIGKVRIERSFFGHNHAGAGEGGAIANRAGASLALLDSTVGGNGRDGSRGAIVNGVADGGEGGNVTLLNATVAFNDGGGLLNRGKALLRSTIVAGNYAQSGTERSFRAGVNCVSEGAGTVTQAWSLVGDDGNCPAYLYADNSRIFTTVLDRLTDAGGPTPVYPLRPGPWAIDNGDPDTCPARDQRGVARPLDGDGDGVARCDMGAVEMAAP